MTNHRTTAAGGASTIEQIRSGYGSRAVEYAELFGSIEAMADDDRRVIAEWVDSVRGPVLDAGSGPGHWTAFLGDRGLEAEGVDLVPGFVDGAAARFPHLRFQVADLAALPFDDSSFGGLLSWYSVIHTEPERVPVIMGEFARVLRPGGTLLLGFFDGAQVEPFDHAVTTAWFWPVDAMAEELARAGFDVVQTYARTDPGSRPHGAICARRMEVLG